MTETLNHDLNSQSDMGAPLKSTVKIHNLHQDRTFVALKKTFDYRCFFKKRNFFGDSPLPRNIEFDNFEAW
jgi:hypothetical protein